MVSVSEVVGCCPLDCQDTCSWVARVEDGHVTSVTGRRDHPFTRGVLCAKVNDFQTRTYANDRLLHPLRRTGPKGSGEFERIDWNEALDLIADRFLGVIKSDGPEALMPLYYLGTMGTMQRHSLRRIFTGLGASNIHGEVCGASMASLSQEGHPIGFDPEETADSRLIILWGVNMLATCHHHWQFVKQARQKHGARVIAIDPRRTQTARQCDQHIAIRPGTDAIFATSMAHVMLAEGIADLDYIKRTASDFEEYCEQAKAWPPERAAEVCGVEPETIINLAREFASADPAVIRTGVGPQQNIQGESYIRSLSALACLGGHWAKRGGGLIAETNPDYDDAAAAALHLAPANTRSIDLSSLGVSLSDRSLLPAIKGLMIWGMNPAVTIVDTNRVRQGLVREDLFTVAVEHFMTDTARFADVVLPSTTQLEHFDIVHPWGHHYISANNPAVDPVGEAKSHGEIMRLLAPRFGLTDPLFTETDEQIAAHALPAYVDIGELKDIGFVKASPPRPSPVDSEMKLKFTSDILEPPRTAGLRLLSPKAHYFLNSTFANMPRQRQSEGNPVVQMNSRDAAESGLSDGQVVRVHNERGEFVSTLSVTDDIVAGAISVGGKWWSVPVETNVVANMLSPSLWSPGGQPAYNDTFVTVEAVAASAVA